MDSEQRKLLDLPHHKTSYWKLQRTQLYKILLLGIAKNQDKLRALNEKAIYLQDIYIECDIKNADSLAELLEVRTTTILRWTVINPLLVAVLLHGCKEFVKNYQKNPVKKLQQAHPATKEAYAAGFPGGLTEVSKKTNTCVETLKNWYRHRNGLFKSVLAGCKK